MLGPLSLNRSAYHAGDVGIALVGDDGFGIIVHFRFAVDDVMLQMLQHVTAQLHFPLYLFVTLEELDGVIAQIVAVDFAFDGLFNVGQCVFHTAAEHVGAFRVGVIAGFFHSLGGRFHAAFALQGGNLQNSATQRLAQFFDINVVAVLAHQIDHIDRHNDRMTQLDQLGGQIQVALDVGAVDDVQNRVGMVIDQIGTGHHFLGRVRGQRIDTGQVLNDHIAMTFQGAFLLFNGDSGPVANILVGTGENVKQCGLTTIGIAGKGNFYAHAKIPRV